MLLKPFIYFWYEKMHMLSKKVFENCKIFQNWIEKNVSLHVSPKNSFLEPNLIQKPTKKQNFHPKKICWVVYSYKNWTYWFLRAYFEISAHTDVPNLFSILNCLFAMNRNPVIWTITYGLNVMPACPATLSSLVWPS